MSGKLFSVRGPAKVFPAFVLLSAFFLFAGFVIGCAGSSSGGGGGGGGGGGNNNDGDNNGGDNGGGDGPTAFYLTRVECESDDFGDIDVEYGDSLQQVELVNVNGKVVQRYFYDEEGKMTRQENRSATEWYDYTYDELDRQTRVDRYDGFWFLYHYIGETEMLSGGTNSYGEEFIYTYNNGNLVRQELKEGGVWWISWTYNLDGQVIRQDASDGDFWFFGYDKNDNMIYTEFSDLSRCYYDYLEEPQKLWLPDGWFSYWPFLSY